MNIFIYLKITDNFVLLFVLWFVYFLCILLNLRYFLCYHVMVNKVVYIMPSPCRKQE